MLECLKPKNIHGLNWILLVLIKKIECSFTLTQLVLICNPSFVATSACLIISHCYFVVGRDLKNFPSMGQIFRCVRISRPGLVSHSLTISLLVDLKLSKPMSRPWQISGTSQSNLRQILCKSQANLIKISGKSWANFGQILGKFWSYLGHILVISW